MQRVDLITDVPFWTAVRGDASRIRSLAEFLAPRTALRIVYLAKPGILAERVVRARMRAGGADFPFAGIAFEPSSRAQVTADLTTVLREDVAAVALVEYVQLSWLLDLLPQGTRPFLDTHQIAHERNERFAAAGLPTIGTFDAAAEYAAFSRYERVILIQEEDRDTAARRIDPGRLLVAPHPVRRFETEIRAHVRRVGFVGSDYLPNVDGLGWFLGAVWPRIGDAVELDIYGAVATRLDPARVPSNARCLGHVDDLDAAYRTLDVAINPVRVGGGLKIKTVEALGAGLPLVTTPEGARGLLDAAGDAYLLAHDADEFAAHLAQLLASRDLRSRLASGARRLAAERFSPEACFGPLLRAIERTA
jgi:glycosyltransferase involved in cell wall biosynthesis